MTSTDASRLCSRNAAFTVVALTVVGAVVRFATLDQQSFWLDELVTVSLVRGGFADMLSAIPKNEATPFLYYVLAWPWARLFGLGEIGLRSLSALAGAAVVPAAYGAGAALVSRRAGIVAAALVSVNPILVWYSQEARSYSLLAFLSACALLFFGRALRSAGWRSLAGWSVFSSLAIATHYFAVFLVLPEAVWLVSRGRSRRSALFASLVPTAVLLAHVPLVLVQRGNGGAVSGTLLFSRIAGIPTGLVVGYSFPAELAGSAAAAALLVVGLALLVTRSSAELRRRALVPGGLAVVSIAVPVALALAGADYVIVRNLILAVVPAAVCVATGFAANRLGLAAAGALCALSLAIGLTASIDDRYGRTDWRGAAERLASPTVGRAIVVTPYMSRSLWSPYLPGLREPSGGKTTVREIAVVGLATEGGFSGGSVRPPGGEPPAPPAGFTLVAAERTPTFTLFRYRAARPISLSDETLAGLRLTDLQPGLLVQPGR